MKIKKIVPFFLSFLMLAGAVILASDYQTEMSQQTGQSTPDEIQKPTETRAVWIPYMTLDVENAEDQKAAFQTKIEQIVKDMKSADLNTAIVQVRPFCDAIYPSQYYPWSHILTGAQGTDPGYDPLAYILEQCHKEDILVHAWINPYRISTQETPSQLCEQHPYVNNPSLGVEINGSLYLNPASSDAQQLITNGVKELVDNYELDGIQFDDYFYPEDCGDFDKDDYEAYRQSTASPLSLKDYRVDQVNRLIRSVYQTVHQADRTIEFGISPQGNLQNNSLLSADVVTWCAKEAYIDYICPQIYFSLDNPVLTFEDSLTEWKKLKQHKGLKMYIGLAAYKAGTDADEGTWLDNDDILTSEVKILRNNNVNGFMLYSYDSFHNKENQTELKHLIDYICNSPTQ